MKILVAPNSFKGSLLSTAVSQAIAKGIKKIKPEWKIIEMPVADGGLGTLEIFARKLKMDFVRRVVKNPLGKHTIAKYAVSLQKKMAIVELARAAGLHLLPENLRNPLITTTYGVGQLISDCIERGCTKIIITVGDSATIDCGIGTMSALGVEFLDRKGMPVTLNCKGLLRLSEIKFNEAARAEILRNEFIVLCDVRNTLTGKEGAIRYAVQKGAKKNMLPTIAMALHNFKSVILKKYQIDLDNIQGSGAAGGFAGGLNAILNAQILSGFEFYEKIFDMKRAIMNADIVVTGEGRIDKTTFCGKATGRIIEMCNKLNKPLIVVCGCYSKDVNLRQHRIKRIYALLDLTDNAKFAMESAGKLLFHLGSEIARNIRIRESVR